MSDKELIKTFIDLVLDKYEWECDDISELLNIYVDRVNCIDKYKDKLWSWCGYQGTIEDEYKTWYDSLNHFIDNEMRDKIKKCLFRLI